GIQALEFKKINILIGGSLGGMQAMELLYNRQFEVEKAIILAATDKTSSYSRAFNEIARQAIHIGGKEGFFIACNQGMFTAALSGVVDRVGL
ncbi:hypothetical protein KC216_20970, partial [Mycobacterium tuberculosis]|nr:hypothetical protein [Mycobacterium tuberculosis]